MTVTYKVKGLNSSHFEEGDVKTLVEHLSTVKTPLEVEVQKDKGLLTAVIYLQGTEVEVYFDKKEKFERLLVPNNFIAESKIVSRKGTIKDAIAIIDALITAQQLYIDIVVQYASAKTLKKPQESTQAETATEAKPTRTKAGKAASAKPTTTKKQGKSA